ncbi:MAG TPA: DUF1285 domain-containing protein [Pseudohongiella sp.]|nr:proteophosphoglycan precursor [Pseudohongiella sp.]HBX38603.1 DUF1285 domain-containing protein [Pseudohongiella sp.]|tara:strand:+ start:1397 stop:1990 length:594 start_codon:yes stop_codon:yes gene_type:complete
MSSAEIKTDNLLKHIKTNRGPAPVHDWDPPYCGEMDMRIAADGRWYHEGSPIGRKRLVQLFSSILRLDPDGFHYLVTPVEKVRIKVDDCPFVAQLVDVVERDGQQVLRFTLNTDEVVEAGPDNPIEVTIDADQQPHPVLEVRHGLKALIIRSVFYSLVEIAETSPVDDKNNKKNNDMEKVLAVSSQGCKFELGRFQG